jgi:hypothetical protein
MEIDPHNYSINEAFPKPKVENHAEVDTKPKPYYQQVRKPYSECRLYSKFLFDLSDVPGHEGHC